MSGPELIVCPAVRGPWGVTDRLGGPPYPKEPEPERAALVRLADGILRRGMLIIARWGGEDAPELAERCFRSALGWLLDVVREEHPLVAYAYDRIGFVLQTQGRLGEAEDWYLQSLALFLKGDWPLSLWTEVTYLNLAILYGQLGQEDQRDRILESLEEARQYESLRDLGALGGDTDVA
jgi:tetratricopeptide (TPR) repeat protein